MQLTASKLCVITLFSLFFIGCGPTSEQIRNSNNIKFSPPSTSFRGDFISGRALNIAEWNPVFSEHSEILRDAEKNRKSITYPIPRIKPLPTYPQQSQNEYESAHIFCALIVSKNGLPFNINCFDIPAYSDDGISNIDIAFIRISEETMATWQFIPGSIDDAKTDFPLIIPFKYVL